jgi:ubiquinone/menaquinone biosynthesis C-methylase UbiE
MRAGLFRTPQHSLSLEIGSGSGYFASLATIDVAVDISFSALNELRKEHDCFVVVADAARLPFKDGSFRRVYVNDVLHHLKAEGVLHESCREINRILERGGILCVSDRLPSFYNSALLVISYWGRKAFSLIPQSQKIRWSGNMDEPPMSEVDYDIINAGMERVSRKRWKNCCVFWTYGFQQLINVIMPENAARRLARFFVKMLNAIEGHLPDWFKTDGCLILKKK